MHALKEGVSEKLSMLFSDSPSQTPDQSPKVSRECNKERKTWTSMLTLLLQPVSLAKVTHSNQNPDVSSLRSDSFTWRSKSFSLKDKPLDKPPTELGQDSELSSPTEECYCDPGTGRSLASDFDVFEDATDPFSSVKSMPNLIDDSLFISPELYDFFDSCLPNIVKGCQWTLVYSTVKDGISLRTLIRNSNNLPGPCLLIAGDKQGAVFGGLLDCPLNPTPKRKYQGTNQSFVFTTIFGEPRLFRPTGANRYFYLCLNDMLALGGGSNFALSLDGDLLMGTSGPSETFGNVCLAHDQEFELKNVELWGFTHASQYLPHQNGA